MTMAMVMTMTEAWPDTRRCAMTMLTMMTMLTEVWPDGDGLQLGRGPENRMIRIMMTMNGEENDGLAWM